MATSSILGGTPAPSQAKGRGTDALGPSDSSDSGSDVSNERRMATGADDPDELGGTPAEAGSDTDRFGTGERASATPGHDHEAADILPDRVTRSPDSSDIDASIDVEDLPSGDDPSAGPDPEHEGDEGDEGDDEEDDRNNAA